MAQHNQIRYRGKHITLICKAHSLNNDCQQGELVPTMIICSCYLLKAQSRLTVTKDSKDNICETLMAKRKHMPVIRYEGLLKQREPENE